MYTLAQNENDPHGICDILYRTPCGSTAYVAGVTLSDNDAETAIYIPNPVMSLKQIKEIVNLIEEHRK